MGVRFPPGGLHARLAQLVERRPYTTMVGGSSPSARTTKSMYEIEATVSGKVHNVGFRLFVERHACALWLVGFVQNEGVGMVKVVAQGPEEKLKKLINYLQKGPFLARVRDVAVAWREPTESFKEFSIL